MSSIYTFYMAPLLGECRWQQMPLFPNPGKH